MVGDFLVGLTTLMTLIKRAALLGCCSFRHGTPPTTAGFIEDMP
jgi:hypothetical protein